MGYRQEESDGIPSGIRECPACKQQVPIEVEDPRDPIASAEFIKHWPPGKDSKKNPPCPYSHLVIGTLGIEE